MATRPNRAGRKRSPRNQPPTDADDVPEPEQQERDDGAAQAAATIDEFIAGVVAEGEADQHGVLVYRRPTNGPNAGRLVYRAPRISLSEFSLDALQQRDGGGNYECRVTRRDERGVYRIVRTFSVVIDGPPKLDVEPAGQLPAGGPVRVVEAPQPDRMERLERMVARLARRLEQQPAAAASPLDMLEKVGSIVQSFNKSGGANGDVMQWLKLGLTLGAKNNGGQPDGFDKFLGELAGPFAQLLTSPNGGQPMTHAPHQAPPLAPPALQPPQRMPGDPAAAKIVPVWLQLAAPYLGFVHTWAQAGDDPEQRAQVALGMIPQSQLEVIATAAEADDFVTSSLDVLPPAFQTPQLREWMRRFLTAIENALIEPEPAEGGDNGNA